MNLSAKPTAFGVSLFLVCILVVALAAVLTWDVFADAELDRASERRNLSLALADELRQSVNVLGRLATRYIVTGDPIFKRHYGVVVATRDGRRARPNGGILAAWTISNTASASAFGRPCPPWSGSAASPFQPPWAKA